ncbi:vWA domain-containing protein [Deinococcus yavapaiensis]|uniref:Ca-activated chloride channel family protein n=1 Tax=Deinococcus yavapaiensis KR-236 TaxID=694435 RepID=A0A318SB93_9DEIO|nr:VWA domain-containing protein [Deinococcus yavapaiensis]PYE55490.1 Ca-activated chloride channel family protein [Deinococcus yavapaiensis KR-236]
MNEPIITFKPLRPSIPSGEDVTLEVLVRISTAPVERVIERPPLNVALVIDRSGSMAGTPMHTAREAAKAFVRELGPNDRVAVVAFDSTVELTVPSTFVDEPDRICAAIDAIRTRGSTALYAGWLEGAQQVALHQQDGVINRVILLSDGHANVGLRTAEDIAPAMRGLNERGVSTSTIGIGDYYDETLLAAISTAGDGNYHFVEHLDQLEPVLRLELGELTSSRGRLVSLGFEPNSAQDVTVVDVLNDLPKTPTGRFMLPNLLAGGSVDTVVRLHVPSEAGMQANVVQPLTVRLAWTDPETGVRTTRRATLELPVLPADVARAQPEDPDVRDRVTHLELARQRALAVTQIDRGDYAGASSTMGAMVGITAYFMDPALRDREQAAIQDLHDALGNRQYEKARKKADSEAYLRRRSK